LLKRTHRQRRRQVPYLIFFVGDTTYTVSATIENLTISYAVAKGGDGGTGAGRVLDLHGPDPNLAGHAAR
jgi:hypothetical protein